MDKNKINSIVGKRIKSLRSLRNITQQKLAEKLNISKREVQYIEAGKRSLSVWRLFEIASVLKFEAWQLLMR